MSTSSKERETPLESITSIHFQNRSDFAQRQTVQVDCKRSKTAKSVNRRLRSTGCHMQTEEHDNKIVHISNWRLRYFCNRTESQKTVRSKQFPIWRHSRCRVTSKVWNPNEPSTFHTEWKRLQPILNSANFRTRIMQRDRIQPLPCSTQWVNSVSQLVSIVPPIFSW